MSLLSTSRATTGLIAAGLITLAAALPATADPSVAAEGDLNGDGTADTITLTAQAEGTEQLLSVTVGGTTHELTLLLSNPDGVAPVRVLDTNKDGKDEVLVTESVSDGTTTFDLVDLGADGLRIIKTPDAQDLRFFESNSPSARSGYTCKDDFFGTNREFTILFAIAGSSDPNPDFVGTLASYKIADGVATPTGQIPIFGVKGDNPQLVVDPGACTA